MSLDNDDSHSSDVTVLYSDEECKRPVTWDNNLGSINGTLLLTGRAIREQLPELHRLIVTNTVEERGITYIDDPAKIDLLESKDLRPHATAHSFTKPCPPTATKVKELSDALAEEELEYTFTTVDKMTTAQLKRYSLQSGPVEKLKSKLLRVLGKIFATTLKTKRLYRESSGDGIAFLEKLVALAKEASPGDEAVLQAAFDDHVRIGVAAQLTESSLSEWKFEYDLLKQKAPMPPDDAKEVFIVGKMVMKHPEVYRDYALATRDRKSVV